MKSTKNNFIVTLALAILTCLPATANVGAEGRGGGSGIVGAFVKIANENVSWLRKNAASVGIIVDVDAFEKAIDSNKIELVNGFTDPIFYKGQRRTALYDSNTDVIQIDETRWRIEELSPLDIHILVAHELCRKAGCEGDDYKVSSRIGDTTCDLTNCGTNDYLQQYRELFYQATPFVPEKNKVIKIVGTHNPIVNRDGIARYSNSYGDIYPNLYLDTTKKVSAAFIGYSTNHIFWMGRQSALNTGDWNYLKKLPQYTQVTNIENGELILRITRDRPDSKDFTAYPVKYTIRRLDATTIVVRTELCINGKWTEDDYFIFDTIRDVKN